MPRLLLGFLIIIFKIIKYAILLALCILILGASAPYIKDIGTNAYLGPVISYEQATNDYVKKAIPTTIDDKDFSRLITGIAIFILFIFINRILYNLQLRYKQQKLYQQVKTLEKKNASPAYQKKVDTLEHKLAEVSSAKGKDRKTLLKEFSQLKKELEKVGRNLAFLSIDVVDSTGMKEGEIPQLVENDFLEYQQFVEAKFREHGFIKAAWTPDGVMACFNTVDDAIQAAKSIIADLVYFNREVKSINSEFVVRCGINSGFVYYDDALPLEQFSDRVLDIAGHMQKHAMPNTISIAKELILPTDDTGEFQTSEKIVDGLQVCQWKL